jgi:ABC-type Na+ efflux pump permease subunit
MNFSSLPVKRVIALACIIAGGVLIRGYGHGFKIPAFYVKYGGSVLWAAMIYFLVALLLRTRPQRQVLVVAVLVCALVEALKLAHTPALDVFRMTRAGIWLLGRVFSGWNFLAYAVGLALALGLDALLIGKKSGGRRR